MQPYRSALWVAGVVVLVLSGCSGDGGDAGLSDDFLVTTTSADGSQAEGSSDSDDSAEGKDAPTHSTAGSTDSEGSSPGKSEGSDAGTSDSTDANSGSTSESGSSTGTTKIVPGKAPADLPDPPDIGSVAAFSSPRAAVDRLFALWKASDKATARSEKVAAVSELDKLFEVPPSKNASNGGCDDGEFGTALCAYVDGDGGISLSAVKIGSSWKIEEINRYYTDGTL